MTHAVEIAHYLIALAARETEPEFLTPLRLQKLLYYVQGWSLALRGNPIFDDPIEAWTHGPAVMSVFQEFKNWKDHPIFPTETSSQLDDHLSERDRRFVASIWESYKQFSAVALREKTHRELPWLRARGDLPPDQPCRNEISQGDMVEFFRKEYRKRQLPGFELERAMAMYSKIKDYTPLKQIGMAKYG